MAALAAASAGATPAGAEGGHEIRSGALALGAHGSFTSVERSTSGSTGVELCYFRAPAGIVLGYHADWRYTRVADLDLVDLAAGLRVMRRVGESSAYPYLGAGVGVRQEWVGSFSQARFPVGVDVGLVALPARGATFGAAYQLRRVLDDPVSDFTEHRLVVSVSMLFRNASD
jgi:hypothetical protein